MCMEGHLQWLHASHCFSETSCPHTPHDVVEEFTDRGLGAVGDGFAEGFVFVEAAEEVAAALEGRIKILIAFKLNGHDLVPLGNSWKWSEIPTLKLDNNVWRYAHSFGNTVGRAAIVTTVPDALGHVTVTVFGEARVSTICN